jgi:hypothetical protein
MARVTPSANDALYGERTDLHGPRASALSRCARWAFYDATDAPRDPDTSPPGVRERGTYLGKAMAAYDADQQRGMGHDVILEMEVAWPRAKPLGVGHIDVFRTKAREVREISSRADAALDPAKAVQAAIYGLNLQPVADLATVVVVDPSNWRKAREFGLDLERLAPSVRVLEDALASALASSTAPGRVCVSPDDPAGRFCPFKLHCFDGWEYPPSKDAAFGYRDELAAMVQALEDRHAAKDALAEAEAKVAELAADLGAIAPGRWIEAGQYELRRRHVRGRRTFDLAGYEASGHELPAGYVKQGDGYMTWDRPRLREDPDA